MSLKTTDYYVLLCFNKKAIENKFRFPTSKQAKSMAFKDTKNRTIVLPICEKSYEHFMNNKSYARELITVFYKSHPELFPPSMSCNYGLNGKTRVSKKIVGFRMRKILEAV